ncbi:MAG: PKD domain-containing protein [Gemmataceae bacterium]
MTSNRGTLACRKTRTRRRFSSLAVEPLEPRWVPAGIVPDAVRFLPGFLLQSLPRGDDNTSSQVSLGFSINYFNQVHNSVFINNNGNVSFGTSYSGYQNSTLANISQQLIAPFFADVDTRTASGGTVYYGQDLVDGRPAFAATWKNVGSYNQKNTLTNTFQVVLIDRSEVGVNAFDVELNYNQITWQFGDASVNSPPRVGFAAGTDPTLSSELPGSGVLNALIDTSPTALVLGSHNSSVAGRYLYTFRNGVLASNQAPDLESIAPMVLVEGETLQVDLDATDPDGNLPLTFTLLSGPSGAQIDTVTGRITWTPQPGQAHGIEAFKVQVTDASATPLTDTEEFLVSYVNVAPVLTVVPPASGLHSVANEFVLTGSFDDPGNGPWVATVDFGDGSGVQPLVLNADNTFTLRHTFLTQANYTILVKIQDDAGDQDTLTFNLNVLPNGAEKLIEVMDRLVVRPGETATSRLTSPTSAASLEVQFTRAEQATTPGEVFLALYNGPPLSTTFDGKFFDIQLKNAFVGDEITLTFNSSEISRGFLFGYFDPRDNTWVNLRDNLEVCEVTVDPFTNTMQVRFKVTHFFDGTVFSVSLAPSTSTTVTGNIRPPTAQAPTSSGGTDSGSSSTTRAVSFTSNTQLAVALTASRDAQVSVNVLARGSQAGNPGVSAANGSTGQAKSLATSTAGGSDSQGGEESQAGEDGSGWHILRGEAELLQLLLHGIDPAILLPDTPAQPPAPRNEEEPAPESKLAGEESTSALVWEVLPDRHWQTPNDGAVLALIPLLPMTTGALRERRRRPGTRWVP